MNFKFSFHYKHSTSINFEIKQEYTKQEILNFDTGNPPKNLCSPLHLIAPSEKMKAHPATRGSFLTIRTFLKHQQVDARISIRLTKLKVKLKLTNSGALCWYAVWTPIRNGVGAVRKSSKEDGRIGIKT